MSRFVRRRPMLAGLVAAFVALGSSSIASAKGIDDLDDDAQDAQNAHPPGVSSPSSPSTFDDRWNASEAAAPVVVTASDRDRDRVVRPDDLSKKRFVVARDFGLSVPLGALSDRSAAMYGPLVRLGFHVTERFEVGFRAGYQRGFDKEIDGVVQSLSAVPMTASFRYFTGQRSGLYGGVEAGVNVFRQRATARTSIWDVGADATWARPCANLGVGFVWSKKYPVDLRTQIGSLDLLSAGKGPVGALAFGVSAGYSIFF